MLQTELITDPERFGALEDAWNGLVSRMESPDLYDTWDWVAACLNDYLEPGDKLFAIAVFDEDRLVAAAPLRLVRERLGALPVRSLYWLAFGTAMYNGFCLDRDYNEAALLKCMADVLGEHGNEWDLLRLGFMNSKNNATFLARQVFGSRFKTYTEEADFVPYLNYAKSYPGKSSRTETKNIERRLRKLTKEHEVRIVLDRPFSPALWEQALEWHLAKWDNSSLQNDKYRGFCRKLYAQLSDKGRLGMSYIEVDGAVAAVNVCHYTDRKAYGKVMNFDPAYAKYGIGLILIDALLRHFRDKGLEEFDFEGGTQSYKFYWTDTVRRNFNHYVCNGNAKKAYVCLWVWFSIFARQSGTLRHWQLRLQAGRAALRRRLPGAALRLPRGKNRRPGGAKTGGASG